jgi:hypothetical protein
MANLKITDIKDELIYNIVDADDSYLDRADDALVHLASTRGVLEADIETTTLPYVLKEYLKAYVGWEVCFNNAGNNNTELHQEEILTDVYAEKLEYYTKHLKKITGMVTKEVLTGDADTPAEYAFSFGEVFRG